ncbi:DNA-directed RNA polymerase [Candidatus Bathyarchaeota archaeon]|nr:DNA-directed RNA polymerase [Candidatus Bathyarchaeota archaeon]
MGCGRCETTFNVVTLTDSVRIPPDKFGGSLENVAKEQLKIKYEGIIDEELGYVIAVTNIEVSPTGKIIPGDGATYHKVTFSLLTFYPRIQEIVEGEVVEVADFGAFVRVGPVDALIHVSQIMDDFISYDDRQGVLMGKETKRKISVGDSVRVRTTAVSLGHGGSFGKIGVTARQPFLGKFEWIEEDIKASRPATEQKTELKDKT